MWFIFERFLYTHHTKFVLTAYGQFQTKGEAIQALLLDGFTRSDLPSFYIKKFENNPPYWVSIPANYKGELR